MAPSVKRLSFFSWEEKGRLLSVVESIGICGFWAEREVYFRRKRDGEDLNLEDDDYTSRKLKESDSESVEKLAKGLSNFVSDLCNKIWNLEEKRGEEVIYAVNNTRYLVIPYFQYLQIICKMLVHFLFSLLEPFIMERIF